MTFLKSLIPRWPAFHPPPFSIFLLLSYKNPGFLGVFIRRNRQGMSILFTRKLTSPVDSF